MKSLLIAVAMMAASTTALADLSIDFDSATYQGRGDDRRGDDNYDRGGGRGGPGRGGPPGYPPGPGHGYPPGYPPYPDRGHGMELIRCESIKSRYAECYFNDYRVRSVYLVRQHSDAPCIRGRTFGIQRGRIWVDRGCRATFQITR